MTRRLRSIMVDGGVVHESHWGCQIEHIAAILVCMETCKNLAIEEIRLASNFMGFLLS